MTASQRLTQLVLSALLTVPAVGFAGDTGLSPADRVVSTGAAGLSAGEDGGEELSTGERWVSAGAAGAGALAAYKAGDVSLKSFKEYSRLSSIEGSTAIIALANGSRAIDSQVTDRVAREIADGDLVEVRVVLEGEEARAKRMKTLSDDIASLEKHRQLVLRRHGLAEDASAKSPDGVKSYVGDSQAEPAVAAERVKRIRSYDAQLADWSRELEEVKSGAVKPSFLEVKRLQGAEVHEYLRAQAAKGLRVRNITRLAASQAKKLGVFLKGGATGVAAVGATIAVGAFADQAAKGRTEGSGYHPKAQSFESATAGRQ